MMKCHMCGSEMIPLLFSLVCGSACDKAKQPPSKEWLPFKWTPVGEADLLYQIISRGEQIPKDAVKGWWISRRKRFDRTPETDEDIIIRAAIEWTHSSYGHGGWPIIHGSQTAQSLTDELKDHEDSDKLVVVTRPK